MRKEFHQQPIYDRYSANTGGFDSRYDFRNEGIQYEEEPFIGGGYDTSVQSSQNAWGRHVTETPRRDLYESVEPIVETREILVRSVFNINRQSYSKEALKLEDLNVKSANIAEELLKDYAILLTKNKNLESYRMYTIDVNVKRSVILDTNIETDEIKKLLNDKGGLIRANVIEDMPNIINDALGEIFNSIFVPTIGVKTLNFKNDLEEIKSLLRESDTDKEISARFKAGVNKFLNDIKKTSTLENGLMIYEYNENSKIIINSESYMESELEDVIEPIEVPEKSVLYKVLKHSSIKNNYVLIGENLYKTNGLTVKKVF